MRQKIAIIIAVIIVAIIAGAITVTNVKFGKYMRSTEISKDEFYKGEGYLIKVNKCEVLDNDKMAERVKDKNQFDAYRNMYGENSKYILVNATLRVTDIDNMPKDWWTGISFEADNMCGNMTDMLLVSIMECNLSIDNYENDREYDVIFPIEINKVQMYNEYYNNSDNWKCRIIWSQNPIVYSNLY